MRTWHVVVLGGARPVRRWSSSPAVAAPAGGSRRRYVPGTPTGALYTTPTTTSLDDGAQYACTVTNPSGGTITTIPVTLRVHPVIAGSAIKVTDASGVTVVRVMDGLGRVVREREANGHLITMTYDAVVGGLLEVARSDTRDAAVDRYPIDWLY